MTSVSESYYPDESERWLETTNTTYCFAELTLTYAIGWPNLQPWNTASLSLTLTLSDGRNRHSRGPFRLKRKKTWGKQCIFGKATISVWAGGCNQLLCQYQYLCEAVAAP